MVLAQLGAGVPNSSFVFLGGLVGVYLFGALESSVSRALPLPAQPPSRCQSMLIWSADKVRPAVERNYQLLAASMAVGLAVFVAFVDYLVPWKSELDVAYSSRESLIGMSAWAPQYCGM